MPRLINFVSVLCLALLLTSNAAFAQRQMETLGRGVVALRTNSTSVYVGWRMLGTDPDDIGFNLYRMTNGGTPVKVNSSPITNSCNYVDTGATLTQTNFWYVRPVTNGVEWAASAAFLLPSNSPVQQYLSVPLQIPPGGTSPDGTAYTYSANDCSVGDFDGDGEYEIVVKWDPSNSKDNSQSNYTGNVYLDAYKLNGTRLWRIDLGINIRAGAHYTQFMVYDLDGDGKAEVACKTAPGTVDGQTNDVIMPGDDPDADYRNPWGYILEGPEYLTVFNGQTGAAMVTTNYIPPRGTLGDWGDEYGNRVDRFLACVAYLDGVRPSLVMCRGYYTGTGGAGRTVLAAWDWRNGQLTQRWVFSASLLTNSTYLGQGNHNLSVGDVDGDGKDEIVYGSCTIDHDGSGLYTTGLGHGDAMHMSDLDPTRPGLEVWGIHEGVTTPGSALFDAGTGEVIWQTANADVGRGVAADLTAAFLGDEVWGGTTGLRSIDNQSAGSAPSSSNFAVWWDADLLRELEDGTSVAKYGGGTLLTGTNCASNNGTKSTPCLSADFFGDWREEVIWRTSDNQYLRIYTTITPATNRFYTLMHDSQYRLAIAWQNVAYNQPPHPGFYLGAGMAQPPRALVSDANLAWRGGNGGNAWDITTTSNWLVNGIWTNDVMTTFAQGNSVMFDLRGANNTSVSLAGSLAPAKVTVFAPADYTFAGSGSLTGAMTLFKAGSGRLILSNTNTYTGGTFVSGGALLVNGTLAGSPVTIENRGSAEDLPQIGGAGKLGQGLTVQRSCSVIVGAGTNVAGILTVSNGLTELGGVLNQFDLSSDPTGATKTNDRVSIVGNLTLTGTNVIAINQPDGSLGNGVYPLFQYTGTLTGGLTNLSLTGDFLQLVVLTNPPGVIGLLAVVPAAPPIAPDNLTAMAIGAFQINLAWTDNSSDENSFLIERSTNNVTFVQIASVSANVTSCSDTGLSTNTTYYYRVRAHNLAGDSDYSNTASAAPPLAPGTLTATAVGPYQINLTWVDNSTDESSFLIERSTDNVIFTPIASVSANDNSYSDIGLSLNTTHYYRVRAHNLAGNSDYSNTASATTLAAVAALTWRGDGTSNIWDVATTANWFDGTNLATYSDGLSVTFDNTGSNSPTINLSADLRPSLVTVTGTKNYTFGGVGGLAGTNMLTKSGTNTLTIGTTNTFSGGIIISNGTVALTGSSVGSYTANTYAPGSGAVTLRGGRFAPYGYNLADNSSGFGTFTNVLVIAAGQTGTVLAGPRQTLASKVTGAGTLNLSVDYVRGDVGGDWSGFTGLLNITPTTGTPASGTIDDFRVTTTAGFPNARLNIGTNVLMYSRATAGSTIPIGEFSGAIGATVSAGGGTSAGIQYAVTWRVGGLDTDTTNAALIQGTSTLIKEGSGSWTLTCTNTYSGSTTVNEGALRVNGNQGAATNTVTVNSSGALGGTGVVGGAVTVNNGGALAPGASIGTLTISNSLTLNSGAVLNFELGATNASDKVVVSGALALGGTLNVTNLAGFGTNTYTLITYGGALSGTLPTVGTMPSGYAGSINTNTAGQVKLVVQVAPPNPPVFTGINLTNGTLTLQGSGGTSNGTYYVLTATNVMTPLAQWQFILTNQFDTNGGFIVTNLVYTNAPVRFYRLQTP